MRAEFKSSFLVSLLAFSAIAALSFGVGRGLLAGAVLTASLYLHEGAHALMCLRRGVHVTAIGVSAMGGYTIRARSNDWLIEAQSAISGPVANLLLSWMFAHLSGNYYHWLGNANLVLALSNLLPFPGSDGWRFWNSLLVPFTSCWNRT